MDDENKNETIEKKNNKKLNFNRFLSRIVGKEQKKGPVRYTLIHWNEMTKEFF